MLFLDFIAYGILIFLLASIVCSYFYRWRIDSQIYRQYISQSVRHLPYREANVPADATVRPQHTVGYCPSVTIVVPEVEQAEHAKKLLPLLLSQRYQGKFEVILSGQKSLDSDYEFVEALKQEYDNFQHIVLPQTLRQIPLRKIAVTLGVKAARYEWVIIVSPDTCPTSESWLASYASYLTEDLDIVSAYYNYESADDFSTQYGMVNRIRKFNLRQYASEHCLNLGAEEANLAFRKGWFFKSRGFSDTLDLPFGEESLWVSTSFSPNRILYLYNPQLSLSEEKPSKRLLRQEAVEQLAIICRQGRESMGYFFRDYLMSVVCTLQLIAFVAYIIVRLLNWSQNQNPLQFSDFYIDLVWCVEIVLFGFFTQYGLYRTLQVLQGTRNFFFLCFCDVIRTFRSPLRFLSYYVHRSSMNRSYK